MNTSWQSVEMFKWNSSLNFSASLFCIWIYQCIVLGTLLRMFCFLDRFFRIKKLCSNGHVMLVVIFPKVWCDSDISKLHRKNNEKQVIIVQYEMASSGLLAWNLRSCSQLPSFKDMLFPDTLIHSNFTRFLINILNTLCCLVISIHMLK